MEEPCCVGSEGPVIKGGQSWTLQSGADDASLVAGGGASETKVMLVRAAPQRCRPFSAERVSKGCSNNFRIVRINFFFIRA